MTHLRDPQLFNVSLNLFHVAMLLFSEGIQMPSILSM